MQFDAKEVLPDEHRHAEGRTQGNRHGAHDHESSDKASGDDQHDDENQAERTDSGDQQVVLGAVFPVLERGRGAGEVDLGIFHRSALERLLGCLPDRVDAREALRRCRIAPMRDDQAHGLAVRRQEVLQRSLEVLVLEDFWRQVERVVVLRLIERVTHGVRVGAHVVHLVENPGHGAVHGQHHRPHVLHAVDHRREIDDQLRHQRVELIKVFCQDLELVVDLVDTVNGIEDGSQGITDRDVVTVLFPVEVAADRPPGVLEVGDVIAQFFGDCLHFLGLADHLVRGGGELLHEAVHVPHPVHGVLELIGLLEHVVHPGLLELHRLYLPGVLHAELERNRRVLHRGALGARNRLHA